jgi:hypothetical protein
MAEPKPVESQANPAKAVTAKLDQQVAGKGVQNTKKPGISNEELQKTALAELFNEIHGVYTET